MTYSPERELQSAIFTILNSDTELKTASAIDPSTGTVRSLSIYNQVPDGASIVYVSFHITDSSNLAGETFDIQTQPTLKNINLLVDVYDEYEPSCLQIAARLQVLLQHVTINTTHFNGSTWMATPAVYFTENQSDPDRVYRRASLRLRVNLQPNENTQSYARFGQAYYG